MNNLVSKENITSLELMKQINFFREKEGKKTKLRHKDLLNIIRDEFDEKIGQRKISPTSYKDQWNREQPMFELTLSQAKQVLVRESKFVRRAIIKYIEELEKGINLKLPLNTTQDLKIKTWRGTPVMTVKEISELLDIGRCMACYVGKKGKLTLRHKELREYKTENKSNPYFSSICIFYKDTVIEICKRYGVYDRFKDLIENYFKSDNRLEYRPINTESSFEKLRDEANKLKQQLLKERFELDEKIKKLNNSGLTDEMKIFRNEKGLLQIAITL